MVAEIAVDPILACHQVIVVGLDAFGAATLDRLPFAGEEFELQRCDDGLRNLVLDGENVGEIAVVAFGPDMIPGRAVDQLRTDADAASGLAHAAFENMRDG